MDPLELLKADLSEGNHEEVISSLKKLTIIASAMGPERTRNELIPFLSEYCQEDNDDFHDESITVVGAELGKFAPLVGANEHVHLLLPILESLACADETAVRSAAVTSIANLVKDLPSNHVLAKVYPVVKRTFPLAVHLLAYPLSLSLSLSSSLPLFLSLSLFLSFSLYVCSCVYLFHFLFSFPLDYRCWVQQPNRNRAGYGLICFLTG